MIDYNKIIKLLLECSPWPWTHENGEILCKGPMVIAQVIGGDDLPCLDEHDENLEPELKANLELISLAPQVIGELICRLVDRMAMGTLWNSPAAFNQESLARLRLKYLKELSIDESLYRQLKERMESNAKHDPD